MKKLLTSIIIIGIGFFANAQKNTKLEIEVLFPGKVLTIVFDDGWTQKNIKALGPVISQEKATSSIEGFYLQGEILNVKGIVPEGTRLVGMKLNIKKSYELLYSFQKGRLSPERAHISP